MAIERFEYVNVKERARALGCMVPTLLALLPRNFDTALSKNELLHESSVPTVRVLFRQAGIVETPLEHAGEQYPQIVEKAFGDWIGPILFVSGAALSGNPMLLQLACGVLSNYLTDFFKGCPDEHNAKLDIVFETAAGCKRIHYEGSASGVKDLAAVVSEMVSDE